MSGEEFTVGAAVWQGDRERTVSADKRFAGERHMKREIS